MGLVYLESVEVGDMESLWTSPVVTVSREGQAGEGQRQVALE